MKRYQPICQVITHGADFNRRIFGTNISSTSCTGKIRFSNSLLENWPLTHQKGWLLVHFDILTNDRFQKGKNARFIPEQTSVLAVLNSWSLTFVAHTHTDKVEQVIRSSVERWVIEWCGYYDS